MNYLTFLVGEIQFDLKDKTLLGFILFSILEGFNLVCGSWSFPITLLSSFRISGLGSRFGSALGTWVFHLVDLFLGPGEWACEPYFSKPTKCKLSSP